jgi:predicted naringenin-chalcone synthase
MTSWINRIETAVPPNEVHSSFVSYIEHRLRGQREAVLFRRLAAKSGIQTRYSFVRPRPDLAGETLPESLDLDGFYRQGNFPTTAERMRWYEEKSLELALQATEPIIDRVGRDEITHVVVASCTGLSAPGLDLLLQSRLGLRSQVERTCVGFMGCYAGITALRLADQIVRSTPQARVLVVSVELCTLHLQDKIEMQDVLGFLQFADGAAAALVSADRHGLELTGFASAVSPEAAPHITWKIGNTGFDMNLSLEVPPTLAQAVPRHWSTLWPTSGPQAADSIRPEFWAVHPGGRAVLDAVETSLGLKPEALEYSRSVLRRFGNMSSATIFFVLQEFLRDRTRQGNGLGMAFGPGLTVESLRWRSHFS